MAFDKDSMLNKVRGLLAKAEASGVTEAEAEMLTAKAAELMSKYGIDEAMASARENRTAKPASKIFTIERPYPGPKAILLSVVAKAFRCHAIELSGDKGVHVFGFSSDLEMVELLYTSLLLQAAHGVLRVDSQKDWAGRSRTRSARSSYLLGFASAIKGRLDQVKQEAEAESQPGTEIVLLSRDVAVKRAVSDVYPKLRTVRRTVSNQGGYSRGHSDGQRANLHNRQEAGAGSRTALN